MQVGLYFFADRTTNKLKARLTAKVIDKEKILITLTQN